jgi:hypothetical protein
VPVYSAHQRPHVSAAVKQLRAWVTLCAVLLAFGAGAQMLVFGFVQFTDVRFVEVRQANADAPLRVVTPSAADDPVPHASIADGPDAVAPGVRATIGQTQHKTVIALSEADAWLERASTLACAAGVMASVVLALLTFMGVLVAGGACVPGVERVVTSAVWSLVLALLCLPWSTLAPQLGLPGVFVGYETMTGAVDRAVAAGRVFGTASAVAQWVVAPGVAMFVALGVCLWFRAGVERGVIATAPSAFDKAVEREVEQIARSGVASSAPKAVGALNRAIGDDALPPAAPSGPAIDETAGLAPSLVGAGATAPRRTRSVADADFKRPI